MKFGSFGCDPIEKSIGFFVHPERVRSSSPAWSLRNAGRSRWQYSLFPVGEPLPFTTEVIARDRTPSGYRETSPLECPGFRRLHPGLRDCTPSGCRTADREPGVLNPDQRNAMKNIVPGFLALLSAVIAAGCISDLLEGSGQKLTGATEVGLNTFSCRVNGENWSARSHFPSPAIRISLLPNGTLHILVHVQAVFWSLRGVLDEAISASLPAIG